MSSFEPFWCPLWSVIDTHKSPPLPNTDDAGRSYQTLQNNVHCTTHDALADFTLSGVSKRAPVQWFYKTIILNLRQIKCYVLKAPMQFVFSGITYIFICGYVWTPAAISIQNKRLCLGSARGPQACREENGIIPSRSSQGSKSEANPNIRRHSEVQNLTHQLFRCREVYSELLWTGLWSQLLS